MRNTSRFEILSIYDRLSDSELAILIGMGGELPPGSTDRMYRTARAIWILRDEQAQGTPRPIRLCRAYAAAANL